TGLVSPAAAQTAGETATPAVTLNDGYVIGVGDVVEIAVLGRDEFKPRVQVQVDGTVQLPYLHSVMASNLTVIQLRERVAKLLRDGGYYVDPVVSVTVVSFASRYVTVLGEFAAPGLVPVDRAYRVSEILARAGGAKPSASDELVLRRAGGEEIILPIELLSRGGLADDPLVQPGDKLFIATAPNFYIYGQVNAPGSYRVERGMTLRMALARGGGLTERGSTSRLSLFRNGKQVRVNLDVVLQGGDTIVVGERFF
ncbi:MAG: SLBB domain-containing protein, partial [Novosphingobium sp.]